MRGDPLALEKDLDGSRRQPYLNLAAGEAVRHAVEVRLDLDVVIDADPAQPPFGKGIGLAGQCLRGRSSSSSSARRVTPSRRIGRFSLSWRSNFPIAAFSSARL